MRVLKICSLLFSLGQFLLVLKLIELVRGNPTPPSNLQIQENIPQQNDATGRSFFLAPSKVKQKKYKLWGTTTTVETPTTDLVDRFGLENEEEYQFESVKNSSDLSPLRKNGTIVPTVEGRLCPGCEGGTCGGSLSSYGFPVIPVVIAIIIGIIWFFIFFFLWYFASEPVKAGYSESNSNSGGYGYAASEQSGGYTSRMNNDPGSIFGLFNSNNNFNQLTTMVTESLFKLAALYNST
ncbi:uncharacterized protein LOC110856226 [Folsomia candida]|uniref:Uncharacterized protein n=1 Tax=Folsomia candida TaxID=158441 RepID=A0A226DP85_FOLCA|nr:uncharacterized protein LOC110856226 [Folsomia candida]OXA46467.1 hypothetical protein Fcan01_18743 [Folsomia candida]